MFGILLTSTAGSLAMPPAPDGPYISLEDEKAGIAIQAPLPDLMYPTFRLDSASLPPFDQAGMIWDSSIFQSRLPGVIKDEQASKN